VVFAALLLVVALVNTFVAPVLPALKVDMGPRHAAASAINEPLDRSAAVAPAESVAAGTAAMPVSLPSGNNIFQSPFVRCAFVVHDDQASVADLLQHLSQVQVVFPDWFSFSTDDGKIRSDVNEELRAPLLAAGTAMFPRISNTDVNGNWHSDELHELFINQDSSDIFIDHLVTALQKVHARGVNLDIEDIHAAEKQNFVLWLDKVASALHEHQLGVTVDVPAYDDAFDYEAIGNIADAVVLMAYDQHYSTGKPGPIAGRSWFNDCVDDALQRIPPGKLIVGMGAYAYDWKAGGHNAEALGFTQAMLLAGQTGAEIETDKESVNSRFSYTDDDGKVHHVWLLDAISCWNEYLSVCKGGARGVALWRTGLEEPNIWKFYGREESQNFDPRSLRTVDSPQSVSFDGDGELLKVDAVPGAGVRDLTFDGDSIDYAAYTTLPSPFLVRRFGRGHSNQIALTFDDGPDPQWTPEILEVLAQNRARGTFFLIGEQADHYPELVRKEFESGHLLGNHTYYHPDIRTISKVRLHIELNSTQRLIESITGHHTILFRAPYDTDTEPTDAAALAPLFEVNNSGYVVVGANVDSDDYDKPSVDQIVKNVMGGLSSSQSNVVVFHDGGGDRSQTVEALRRLIPMLKNEGYQFVGIDQLMGKSTAVVMPPVAQAEQVLVMSSSFMIHLRKWGWTFIVVLFALTTAISILRICLLGYLVTRDVRKAGTVVGGDLVGEDLVGGDLVGGDFFPPVRIIIPAFNEQKLIERTLDAALASDYPNLQVTVVDDGSDDSTADVVRAYSLSDARVSLIEQTNTGKASALNNAFAAAAEEFVVTIDADTIIMKHAVSEMMRRFADPSVDAVCGNVQVGNVHSILTAFQNIEYITSQNYDRRAFDHLNCISVVPGATGAWRRERVLKLGGYSTDTLTEDADLTLTLLGDGGRVVYAPLAQSITEAPETVRTLFRQRFRWSFGTLQCLWKHREQAGRGSLGWIALPNIFFFQLLFPMLAPVGDVILLLCVLRHDFGAVAAGYLIFLVMDLIGSSIALRLDHRPLTGAWVVFIQRFYYRQFMYVVTIAALLASFAGRRHGWNKLNRSGSVGGNDRREPSYGAVAAALPGFAGGVACGSSMRSSRPSSNFS
jgi:cellulose synthase/poly-beta-1,6-N-acetylglucosamine synthase-like glycosyltransferase/spore germination protein YaaH/peptidoglycan/xylan/chitin deacetylase (PgdA/CDA1 family)